MVRNFSGTKFSQIGRWQRFRKKIFAVRQSQSTKHNDHKISRLKFSWSEANPQKLRKFCPTKILVVKVLKIKARMIPARVANCFPTAKLASVVNAGHLYTN